MPTAKLKPRLVAAIDRWNRSREAAYAFAHASAEAAFEGWEDPASDDRSGDEEQADRAALVKLLRQTECLAVYRGVAYFVEGANRIRTQDVLTLD